MSIKKIVLFIYNIVAEQIIGRLISGITGTMMSGFFIPAIIFSIITFISGLGFGYLFWG